MNKINYYDETKKTNMVSTVFTDGMVVTADDLDTAMRYPIELIQTLIRAYFGCGIVCGLEVKRDPEGDGDTFCVKIEPGVALDCHGHSLQLCDSVKIDLTPDPCACEEPPTCLCIAIRRDTVSEAPRQDTDACDGDGKASCQYARERDLVRLKVFKPEDLDLLKTLCALPENPNSSATTECNCLKACPDMHCCGESWVLLACVIINYEKCNVVVDLDRRKYIKPIACQCPPGVGAMVESISTPQAAKMGKAATKTANPSRKMAAKPSAKTK